MFYNDFIAQKIATGLLGRLSKQRRQSGEGARQVHRLRNDILGNLALSRLCRPLLVETDTVIEDLGEEMWANLLPEPMYIDDQKWSLDRRIHVPPHTISDWPIEETSDPDKAPPELWYRSEDEEGVLYIHRPRIAIPTDQYRNHLQSLGVQAYFAELETLFPYVASRDART